MDRAVRLANLWNWLPAFRAVAETQHLPSAARSMRLSPSALSRSVSQLEAALEQQLFVRSKRRMQLNPAGAALLTAVRDAMRRIDDGLNALSVRQPTSVRAAGEGAWIGLLIAPVVGDHAIEIEHVEISPVEVRDALLRGVVDLALVETVPASDEIVIERLGTVTRAVCVASKRTPAAFAAWTDASESWPLELPREVALRSRRLDAVIEACRSGSMRAALPTAIALAHDLRAMAAPRLPSSQLYLVRRIPLGTSPLDAVLPAIRQRARKLLVA